MPERWRVGQHIPIHLYQQLGPEPSDDDPPIGTMLAPEHAAHAADAVNRLDDLAVLAAVGRMYLDALDADPDNEYLAAAEAFRVTEVRDAVERHEVR